MQKNSLVAKKSSGIKKNSLVAKKSSGIQTKRLAEKKIGNEKASGQNNKKKVNNENEETMVNTTINKIRKQEKQHNNVTAQPVRDQDGRINCS